MNNSSNQKSKKLGQIYFFMLGIGGLIGWNAILTALDYFASKFKDFNVNFYISIPYFVATCSASLLIYYIAKFLSINVRIIGGQIGMIVTMVFLPILAQLLQNATGFYITLLIVFLLGLFNSVMQSTGIAFASIFPRDNYIPIFFTGTGVAGVIVGILRMICLASFGTDENGMIIGTIIYFIVSAFFLIVNIFLHIAFKNTGYSRYHIKVSNQKTITDEERIYVDSIITTQQEQDQLRLALYQNQNDTTINDKSNVNSNSAISYNDDLKQKLIDNNQNREKKSGISFIYSVLAKIMPMPLCVFLIYVQTFMMFPGITFSKHYFQADLNNAWGPTLIVFTYNIFDTLGKILSEKIKFTVKSATLIVISRFLFFTIFLLMILPKIDDPIIKADWVPFINISAFALTNGYATSAHMCLGPQKASDDEKETAGFLMSFPLYFGILSGSMIALAFQNLGQ